MKIPVIFFAEKVKKKILKFVQNLKGPQIAKKNLKKNKTGGFTPLIS